MRFRPNAAKATLATLTLLALPIAPAHAEDAGAANAHWRTGADASPWDAAARTSVEASTLSATTPTDIDAFCPAYASLDGPARNAFWVSLLSAIAAQESGGDARKVRWHAYDNAAHRPTFRRGLFQISIESAQSRAYQCNVPNAADLYSPNASVACATRILERTVTTANAIANAGRYWSSLRHSDSRRTIAAATASRAPCPAP